MDEGGSYRSPQEVADLLGVTEVTVRRWVSDGRLEAVRLGDSPQPHLRVTGAALARFLRSTRRVERAVAPHARVEQRGRL